MKQYTLRKRIFLGLTILVTAFIFGQSLMDFSQSQTQSGRLVRWLLALCDRLEITVDGDWLHHLVRKVAHFCEFALLGIYVGGYAWNLSRLQERRCCAFPAWLTLAIAVCDEFIQSFTGRGSAVTDVVLDYTGALVGLLTVMAFLWIKKKITRRKKYEN